MEFLISFIALSSALLSSFAGGGFSILMQFVLSKDTMQTMLAVFLVLSAAYLALSKKNKAW